MRVILLFFIISLFASCQDEVIIKPKAQLRLEYPIANFEDVSIDLPYHFQKNKVAVLKEKRNNALNLYYPAMKATLYLTYQKVGKNNIDSLLRDAQKLAYDHAVKAESIPEQPFVNKENDVYGMFYMINGNAATQAEFYATDSVQHFINGALYFDAKPNFDSIYPAVMYLRNDMRIIMETLEWKTEE
ncbi:MAG: gliding motility-associated lipoprotein GldD [Flavobacteriaceae bacterium]|jgi:gliding motility-associated lipoprotein GldD